MLWACVFFPTSCSSLEVTFHGYSDHRVIAGSSSSPAPTKSAVKTWQSLVPLWVRTLDLSQSIGRGDLAKRSWRTGD